MKVFTFTSQFIWFPLVGVNNYRNIVIKDIVEFVLSARANVIFKCWARFKIRREVAISSKEITDSF